MKPATNNFSLSSHDLFYKAGVFACGLSDSLRAWARQVQDNLSERKIFPTCVIRVKEVITNCTQAAQSRSAFFGMNQELWGIHVVITTFQDLLQSHQLCVARSSLRQNVKNDYVSVTIKLYLYKQILGWIHSSGHSLPIANYEFEINSKSPLVCILMINKNFLLMCLSCHTYSIWILGHVFQ